jgi:hypothetical protein
VIAALQQERADLLSALQTQQDEDSTAAAITASAELEETRARHASALATAQQEHAAELAALRQQHAASLNAQEAQHRAALGASQDAAYEFRHRQLAEDGSRAASELAAARREVEALQELLQAARSVATSAAQQQVCLLMRR